MKKIEVSLQNLKSEVSSFYATEEWHFMGMNGVDVDGRVEVQWFFVPYNDEEEPRCLTCLVEHDALIPSLTELIPSAWASEGEFYDFFDVKIENAEKGFFLDEDDQRPLRERP